MKDRELKFRAWNKLRKCFVPHGSDVRLECNSPSVFHLHIKNGSGIGYFADCGHIELSQYTGLKDKNEKEIYEGDILRIVSTDGTQKHIKIMQFENHTIGDFMNWEISGYRDYSKSTYGYNVEIIGNIYENKNLLK